MRRPSDERIEGLFKMVRPLLHWYTQNRRILPWRTKPTPYRVWVSEIMLQQTRVSAVIPYFERFVAVLPDLPALADADEDTLLKLWEGLGYYSRVRNMQRAARLAVERGLCDLPADYEALRSLPGIGPYTAGAIASIAFGMPYAAVDGNVLRVFSRLLACEEDISDSKVKKTFEQLASSVIPEERPGDFNQALMELGAIICLPGGMPKCALCPVRECCTAYLLGCPEAFPVKAPKKPRRMEERTILVLVKDGRVLLRKRPAGGLLAGLYEFVNLEGVLDRKDCLHWLQERGASVREIVTLREAKHIFSHVEWHMRGFLVKLEEAGTLSGIWADFAELSDAYALPGALKVYLQALLEWRARSVQDI